MPTGPIRSASWSFPTVWSLRSAPTRRRPTNCARDYGLGPGRVLVFPAITHPHKGHLFLLERDGPILG